jgi:pimeloyl-ACP methyl ester carboxylesterase
VLAGVGLSLIGERDLRETIAAALEAPSLAAVTDPTGRTFRGFAEQTRSDLRALAACIRGSSERLSRADAAAIRVPILVAAGTADNVAGPVRPLADLIPGAQVLEIPDRDHMRSVGDRVFKEGTLGFLAARSRG